MEAAPYVHHDGRVLRLGKGGVIYDPRNLKLATYDHLLAPPPDAVSWYQDLKQWGMMGNDVRSDCTCAAIGHGAQVVTLNTPTGIRTPPDNLILNLYQKACGWVPGNPATDQGGNILDVLKFVRKHALGHKHEPNYHRKFRLLAFAQVNQNNLVHVKQGIELFRVVDIGLQLPVSAQSQVGGLWDITNGPNAQAGSWGGHSVTVSSYTPQIVTCITWGQLQAMTWAFWLRYCDEAYVLLYRALIEQMMQKAPKIVAAFESDLNLIAA